MTRPRAAVVVRNGFVYDARVLRAARTLREAGYQPLVVATLTASGQAASEVVDGLPVVRVSPSAPVAWIEQRFQRRMAPQGVSPATSAADQSRRGWVASPALHAFRWARTVDYYLRAARVVLGHRPTLVHCNDHNTMWIGVAAKVLARARILYDAHELWPDRNGRWEWRAWLLVTEAVFTRVADEVVVASPGFVGLMARRYRIPEPRVVRNVPVGAEPPPVQQAPVGDPIAVYVGALLLGRGLEQAIEAVALVPRVRLRLIGHGGETSIGEALLGHARAAGIEDRFEIHPPVPPERVVAALGGASVGLSLFQPICLSHELTLPNKLFEYVAAGLPVLTSDMTVSAEFVRGHGVGEVVAARDPDAIARAISSLLDPARRESMRPRLEMTAREHTWARERERLIAAYAAAVA